MSIKPSDVLNKNKNLNKRVLLEEINLDNVTINDLKYTGDNYIEYINLISLLENVSSCQISDAYNNVSKRSGTFKKIKSINNLKIWGSVFTAETSSDDWGTSALAIDQANDGDILFFKVDNDNNAVWGELASICAKNNGIKGCVVYGSVRDLDALLGIDFPIFASNYLPSAGLPLGLGILNEPIDIDGCIVNPNDFLFGDESGIVVIPQKYFQKVMQETLNVKIKELSIVDSILDGYSLTQITGLK